MFKKHNPAWRFTNPRPFLTRCARSVCDSSVLADAGNESMELSFPKRRVFVILFSLRLRSHSSIFPQCETESEPYRPVKPQVQPIHFVTLFTYISFKPKNFQKLQKKNTNKLNHIYRGIFKLSIPTTFLLKQT